MREGQRAHAPLKLKRGWSRDPVEGEIRGGFWLTRDGRFILLQNQHTRKGSWRLDASGYEDFRLLEEHGLCRRDFSTRREARARLQDMLDLHQAEQARIRADRTPPSSATSI